MTGNHHIVMRQIVELETSSREAAFSLQERVAGICRNELPALLNDVCQRCDDSGRVFRIDRLEVDLGRVSPSQLEDEIRAKTAWKLFEALQEYIDRLRLRGDSATFEGSLQPPKDDLPEMTTASDGDRMLSAVDADHELILFFLDTGTLPWSAVAGSGVSLDARLTKLLQTAPQKVPAILEFVAARPAARRRLIAQFGPDVLRKLVRHGSPDGGQRLKSWLRDYEAAVAAADLDQTGKNELWTSFWDRALFDYAAIPADRLPAAAFWHQTIATAAAQSGLKAGAIAGALMKSAGRAAGVSATFRSTLATVRDQLTGPTESGSERPQQMPAESPPAGGTAEKNSAQTRDSMPRPDDGTAAAAAVSAQAAGEQENKPALPGYTSWEVRTSGTDQYSQHEPPEDRTSQVKRKAGFETSPAKRDGRPPPWQPAGLPADPEHEAVSDDVYPDIRFEIKPEQDVPLPSGLVEGDAETLPGGKEIPRAMSPPSGPPTKKAAPVYLSGIDADTALQEIYIDNAGLVIGWPFLSNFFKTLDLLEEDHFVDDRAKARAIYLLQYLTTGAEEFPEYVLPLNKLLCGWEIGEPLEREYRLTDLEKSESQKLLEAIISHWSALKQTSVDGLRTSFLQRKAVLIETMRHWLLRVERQPYDMLLDRLPWGISMIRLSWMEKMLMVEW